MLREQIRSIFRRGGSRKKYVEKGDYNVPHFAAGRAEEGEEFFKHCRNFLGIEVGLRECTHLSICFDIPFHGHRRSWPKLSRENDDFEDFIERLPVQNKFLAWFNIVFSPYTLVWIHESRQS